MIILLLLLFCIYSYKLDGIKDKVKYRPDIFETVDIEKKYSSLFERGQSYDSILIRCTNFYKPREQINKLPQVLISTRVTDSDVYGYELILDYLDLLAEYKTNDMWDLLNTRLILILVTSDHKLNYSQNTNRHSKETGGDFPYDNPDGKCFYGLFSRLVNEVMRDHLIVTSIFLKFGKNTLSYPWSDGASRNTPPDLAAFEGITKYIERIVTQEHSVKITIGSSESVFGERKGSIEDWMYASSWDGSSLSICQNTLSVNGNYSKDRQLYNNETHRVLSFRFEIQTQRFGIPNRKESVPDSHYEVRAMLNTINQIAYMAYPELIVSRWMYDGEYKYGRLEFKVLGCINLDQILFTYSYSFHEAGRDREEIEKSVNITEKCKPPYDHCYVDIDIGQISSPISGRFEFSCDHSWYYTNTSGTPESHLIRMRSNNQYYVNNGEFYLEYSGDPSRIIMGFNTTENAYLVTVTQSESILLPTKTNYKISGVVQDFFPISKACVGYVRLTEKGPTQSQDKSRNITAVVDLNSRILNESHIVSFFDIVNRNQYYLYDNYTVSRESSILFTIRDTVLIYGKVFMVTQIDKKMNKTLCHGIVEERNHRIAGLASVPTADIQIGKGRLLVQFQKLSNNRCWVVSFGFDINDNSIKQGYKIRLHGVEEDLKIGKELMSYSVSEIDEKAGVFRVETRIEKIRLGEKLFILINNLQPVLFQIFGSNSYNNRTKNYYFVEYHSLREEVKQQIMLDNQSRMSEPLKNFLILLMITVPIMLIFVYHKFCVDGSTHPEDIGIEINELHPLKTKRP